MIKGSKNTSKKGQDKKTQGKSQKMAEDENEIGYDDGIGKGSYEPPAIDENSQNNSNINEYNESLGEIKETLNSNEYNDKNHYGTSIIAKNVEKKLFKLLSEKENLRTYNHSLYGMIQHQDKRINHLLGDVKECISEIESSIGEQINGINDKLRFDDRLIKYDHEINELYENSKNYAEYYQNMAYDLLHEKSINSLASNIGKRVEEYQIAHKELTSIIQKQREKRNKDIIGQLKIILETYK